MKTGNLTYSKAEIENNIRNAVRLAEGKISESQARRMYGNLFNEWFDRFTKDILVTYESKQKLLRTYGVGEFVQNFKDYYSNINGNIKHMVEFYEEYIKNGFGEPEPEITPESVEELWDRTNYILSGDFSLIKPIQLDVSDERHKEAQKKFNTLYSVMCDAMRQIMFTILDIEEYWDEVPYSQQYWDKNMHELKSEVLDLNRITSEYNEMIKKIKINQPSNFFSFMICITHILNM